MSKKLIGFAALTIGVLIGASAALTASAPNSKEKDVIIVGMEAQFKPYEYRDTNGQIVGFDVDMVNSLAKKLGKKVQFVDMSFDALIPTLLIGKIDMIASGMSITPERSKKIAFSESYYATPDSSTDAIVVRPDEKAINSLKTIKGKKLAVQLGTTQDVFMTGLSDKGPSEIKRFPHVEESLREVMLGRSDFTFISKTVTLKILEAKDFKGKVKIACFTYGTGGKGVGFGFSKENAGLRNSIDKALVELKASPEYAAIKKKWNVD